MELLAGSLALYARNPGFPELVHLPMLTLRRFIKASPVEKFRSQATLLLHAVGSHAKYVGMQRDGVDFAPKDTDSTAAFLACALTPHCSEPRCGMRVCCMCTLPTL
jgi:nucleolar complex protein 2